MKQHGDLSLWLVALAGCSAFVSIACGDAAGSASDGPPGASGTTNVTAGAGGGISGGSATAGSGGSAASLGGTASGTAGSAPVAGTTSGGTGAAGDVSASGSGGAGVAGGGSGGASAGSGGAAGGGGAGAGNGGAGGSAGSGANPFGIVSCQPAFEVACKPAIQFTNGDPNGRGLVFTNAIPDVEGTMKDIACVVCSMLYRTPDEIPQGKKPSTIKLILDDHGGVAQTGGATIQFDLTYINGYANASAADTKQEMLGVLQHETVHIYQNYGNNGTGEGEADLVRARMGYYKKSRWRKGEGTWKDAYTASGNFYSWLTGPCSYHSTFYPGHDLDFPYKLNKALGGTSGDASYTAVSNLLMQLFGKGPDELWTQYQNTAF